MTSDNPRREDPFAILRDVETGMEGAAYEVVEDRREAIRRAIEVADPDGAVLIAGKGHETTQDLGSRVVPFDDRAVAGELLEDPS